MPNGTGDAATFTGATDITVDQQVTLSDLYFGTPDGTGNPSGIVNLLAGAGTLTFKSNSNVANIWALRSGSYQLSPNGSNGEIKIAAPVILDVDVLNVTSRVTAITGNMTAASGRSVTVNLHPGNINLSGANDFGATGKLVLKPLQAGTRVNITSAGGGGGANTTWEFAGSSFMGRIDLTSTDAFVTYDSDVVVSGQGGGIIMLAGGQTMTRNHRVGSITIENNRTLTISPQTVNQIRNLRVNTGEHVYIGTGSLLLVKPYDNVGHQGDMFISGGSRVIGSGTMATARFSTSSLSRIELESGSVLSPGDDRGQTGSEQVGILSIGSEAHTETSVSMLAGSEVRLDLKGVTAGGSNGHDQIRVTGEDTVFAMGGDDISGVKLVLSLGYAYEAGDKLFLLISQEGGSVNGTFQGLAQGASLALGQFGDRDYIAKISYVGDSANNSTTGGGDIVLYDFNYVVVPEPSTVLLIGVGAIAGLCRLRRRRD